MTQLVSTNEAQKGLQATLQSDGMLRQLRMACAKTVTPERMARIAMTELRRVPKLATCTPQSFLGALMQCAQLGLEPGPMGLAYLIPYGNEVTLQVGYKGLLQLVWRSEQIASVQSEVVYEGDVFEYAHGIPPTLHHIPADHRPADAKPTHVYAVLGTKGGGWITRVRTAEQIEAHRKKYSQAGGKSPWVTAWDEMACKTVIKLAVKRAPVSSEVIAAVALDDQAETGNRQDLAVAVELPDAQIEAPPESKLCPTCTTNLIDPDVQAECDVCVSGGADDA